MFYKAIVQTVLLYGSESWVVAPQMLEVLKGFHHRVARKIPGKMARRQADGSWVYPPIVDALEGVGLFPMDEYIRRRQNRMVQYLATRHILPLIQAAPESRSRLRWWCQRTVISEAPEDE